MAPAIHSAKGNSLVALATRDLEKANKFLKLSDRLEIYNDYNDLLEDSNVDAVYIPLPNHIHIEWATRCLQAGKHVLCEKPISMAADEIDRLIHLRDKAQLLAAEAYMVVHHPQWQLAKEFVDAGKLGKLVQIDGDRKSTRLELQSHSDLVCRLLLEKKKRKKKTKNTKKK